LILDLALELEPLASHQRREERLLHFGVQETLPLADLRLGPGDVPLRLADAGAPLSSDLEPCETTTPKSVVAPESPGSFRSRRAASPPTSGLN
jgi:hypothetical protein